jgi:Spy/CpxP family protein refolding chaperone
MKNIPLFFLVVIATAALSAVCATRWVAGRSVEPTLTAHEWLHTQLHLTEDQHKALEPVEAQFAAKERSLVDQLHAANRDLARAMGEDRAYTPRVAAAVEMVHHRMGDLQKASIEHVFAMRSMLTKEQSDKLLELAQRTLEQVP